MVNYRFPNPFWRNHCMVLALTHLTGKIGHEGERAARAIAEAAYRRKALCLVVSGHESVSSGAPLLSRRGVATIARSDANLQQWAEISGVALDIPAKLAFGYGSRVTVQRFVREHPTGSWLVFTHGHAQALIDGEMLGLWRARALVQLAVPVKAAPAEVRRAYDDNARWQEQLRQARLTAVARRGSYQDNAKWQHQLSQARAVAAARRAARKEAP